MIELIAYIVFGVYAVLSTCVTVAAYYDDDDDGGGNGPGSSVPLWRYVWFGMGWPWHLWQAYRRPGPELESWEGDDDTDPR